eukprot:g6097.t1
MRLMRLRQPCVRAANTMSGLKKGKLASAGRSKRKWDSLMTIKQMKAFLTAHNVQFRSKCCLDLESFLLSCTTYVHPQAARGQ